MSRPRHPHLNPCGHEGSRIFDCYRDGLGYMTRRRKCLTCGRKWNTIELRTDEFKDLHSIIDSFAKGLAQTL